MKIILYPTETVYGLGVNPFDYDAVRALYVLKGREEGKRVSWLVRSVEDIKRYAVISDTALKVAEEFIPGPLTLILKLTDDTRNLYGLKYDDVGFRISSDPVAQKVISEHMEKFDAPLTSTSANVSGMQTLKTPIEILHQFGDKKDTITDIYDDGERSGTHSTVISIFDNEIACIREGTIPFAKIKEIII